jgi:hypothetical protein
MLTTFNTCFNSLSYIEFRLKRQVKVTVSFPFSAISIRSKISRRFFIVASLILYCFCFNFTFPQTSFSSLIPSFKSSIDVIIIPTNKDNNTMTPMTTMITKYQAAIQPRPLGEWHGVSSPLYTSQPYLRVRQNRKWDIYSHICSRHIRPII